ncbi:MAG: hypothetical protein ABIH38_05045 [Patescibacteria group bacterium]
MRRFLSFCLMFLTVPMIGCVAGQYLPKQALINPVDGISVPHPVEIEKVGVKTITTFQGLMDSGLWVEVVGAGGVWPWLARTPLGEILDGYAYLTGINYWGDWQLQFVFLGSVKELQFVKILYFNRDAGYCYKLTGVQAEYDPQKFDTSEDYRNKIFQEYGMTLKELDGFWLDYLREKELNPPQTLSSAIELKTDSPEWEDFKSRVARVFPYNYKMGNGEIRSSYLPLESFRQAAVEIPGFNGVDRYLKRAKLPIVALPFAGAGLLVIAGASVAGDAVSAGIDANWTGAYARAETLRYKMAPLFRQICLVYKELLKKRDERIKNLQFQLRFQNWTSQNPQIGEGR